MTTDQWLWLPNQRDGDLVYRRGFQWDVLHKGTSGQVLLLSGSPLRPAWGTIAAGATIATSVESVASANSTGTVTRYAPEDHRHAGIYAEGVSTGGNTLGNTTVQPGRIVWAGGANITLSVGTAAGGLQTVTIVGPAAGAGVLATTVSSVLSANSVATQTRYAGEDHGHEGIYAVGVSTGGNTAGNTTVQPGRVVFAGGNNITLSVGTGAGALQTITISGPNTAAQPPIATQVFSVATANSTGTITRYAPEDHRHEGVMIAGISGGNTSGNTTRQAGSFYLAGGDNITISGSTAAGGQTYTISAAAGGGGVIATTVQSVATANSVGTVTRFAPEDHRHEGVYAVGVSNVGNSSGNTMVQPGRVVLAGGNNITLSVGTAANALQTITVSAANSAPATFSYWHQPHWYNFQQAISGSSASSAHVQPFELPVYVSVSYIRFHGTFTMASTSLGTSAVPWNTTFSQAQTMWAVIYSQGVGASSRSLQYVTSGSAGWTWQVSATGAVSTNRWTVSQNLTWPQEGANTNNAAFNYASTLSTVNVSTTGLTNFTGRVRYIDIPFAALVTPGNYWMAIHRSTATGGGKNIDWAFSVMGAAHDDNSIGNLGAATNATNHLWRGLGSFSTNVNGTTSSMALSAISKLLSNVEPAFQFIREA